MEFHTKNQYDAHADRRPFEPGAELGHDDDEDEDEAAVKRSARSLSGLGHTVMTRDKDGHPTEGVLHFRLPEQPFIPRQRPPAESETPPANVQADGTELAAALPDTRADVLPEDIDDTDYAELAAAAASEQPLVSASVAQHTAEFRSTPVSPPQTVEAPPTYVPVRPGDVWRPAPVSQSESQPPGGNLPPAEYRLDQPPEQTPPAPSADGGANQPPRPPFGFEGPPSSGDAEPPSPPGGGNLPPTFHAAHNLRNPRAALRRQLRRPSVAAASANQLANPQAVYEAERRGLRRGLLAGGVVGWWLRGRRAKRQLGAAQKHIRSQQADIKSLQSQRATAERDMQALHRRIDLQPQPAATASPNMLRGQETMPPSAAGNVPRAETIHPTAVPHVAETLHPPATEQLAAAPAEANNPPDEKLAAEQPPRAFTEWQKVVYANSEAAGAKQPRPGESYVWEKRQEASQQHAVQPGATVIAMHTSTTAPWPSAVSPGLPSGTTAPALPANDAGGDQPLLPAGHRRASHAVGTLLIWLLIALFAFAIAAAAQLLL